VTHFLDILRRGWREETADRVELDWIERAIGTGYATMAKNDREDGQSPMT
jgi:hypothetical protein